MLRIRKLYYYYYYYIILYYTLLFPLCSNIWVCWTEICSHRTVGIKSEAMSIIS